jgi:hypothetical protein
LGVFRNDVNFLETLTPKGMKAKNLTGSSSLILENTEIKVNNLYQEYFFLELPLINSKQGFALEAATNHK